MKIEAIEYSGIPTSMRAMRNPMDSWAKGDSTWFNIGSADKELSIKLQVAGEEHAKHLRMVMISADITAPRYWWTEFDTYRFGVEKVSCSTMHKLMSKPLKMEDFEPCNNGCFSEQMIHTVDYLNELIKAYNTEKDQQAKRSIWEYAVQILPQSYLQKRTVQMSYAALRRMYRQRKGHKLREWQVFREWVEGLPNSWMITE